MQIFLQFCGDLNMTLKHPNQANHHENAFDNPVSLQKYIKRNYKVGYLLNRCYFCHGFNWERDDGSDKR